MKWTKIKYFETIKSLQNIFLLTSAVLFDFK